VPTLPLYFPVSIIQVLNDYPDSISPAIYKLPTGLIRINLISSGKLILYSAFSMALILSLPLIIGTSFKVSLMVTI
jgi:hypothetical protein